MFSCKKIFRTVVSYMLVLSMVIPTNFDAFADAIKKDNTSNVKEINVKGKRLDEDLKGGRGNIVYFGVLNIDANEKDAAIYNVPIYRDGNLEKKENVVIRTHDIAALYGKDYILLGDNKQEYENDMTLLERAMKNSSEFEYKPKKFEYDIENDTIKEIEREDNENSNNSSNLIDEKGDNIENNIIVDDDDKDDSNNEILLNFGINKATKSTLALWKEVEGGIHSRETVSTLENNISDAIISKFASQYMEKLIYSSEQIITFDEGESEKILSFKILDDKLAEGQEMFSISMVSSDYSEVYGGKLLSVNIKDDEKVEKAKIRFEKNTYNIEDGKVNFKVLREGFDKTLVSCKLKGKIKKIKEEEIIYGVIVFAPYEKEKEITIDAYDNSTLYFDELVSAENGDIKEATVKKPISISTTLFGNAPLFGTTGLVENRKFKINDREYFVDIPYTDTNKTEFDIYDESVTPPVKVGVFMSAIPAEKGGMFTYGHFWGDSCKDRHSYYYMRTEKGNKNEKLGTGAFKYHSKLTTDEGGSGAYISYADSKIHPWAYQFIAPYWSQTDSHNPQADVWYNAGADATRGSYIVRNIRQGKFATDFVDVEKGLQIKRYNDFNAYKNKKPNKVAYRTITVGVGAQDSRGGTFSGGASSSVYVSGIAAFYKKYRVSTVAPNVLKYKVYKPDGTFTNELKSPISKFTIKSGVSSLASKDTYFGENLVFEFEGTNLGQIGEKADIYGELKSYNITVAPNSPDPVTLSYPKDFHDWLQKVYDNDASPEERTKAIGDKFKFSEIKERIESVSGYPTSTITIDRYFDMWIENNTPHTVADGRVCDKAYYTELSFQPVFENIKCDTILLDSQDNIAKFIAEENMKKEIAGSGLNYGDLLYLGAKISDDKKAEYDIDGFEYSTDGGIYFNTIRDKQYLLLSQKDKAYRIRPAYMDAKNRIEIEMPNGIDREHFVGKLVPLELLEGTPALKGKNILDIHPEEKDIWKRIKPEVGGIYSFGWLGKDKIAAVIDPIIPKNKYEATKFYFVARNNIIDNCFKLQGMSKSSKPISLEKISVKQEIRYIRGKVSKSRLSPLKNAIISFASCDYNSSDIYSSYKDESYVLNDNGELIIDKNIIKWQKLNHTILVAQSNGVKYIIDSSMTDETKYDYIINYNPNDVPEFLAISYKYDSAANNSKIKLDSDRIEIFDDSITLSATLDIKNRSIKKIVYNFYHSDNTLYASYDAMPISSNPKETMFSCKIKKMNKVISNGDYMTANIYDKELNEIVVKDKKTGEEKKEYVDIVYPELDTGYIYYTSSMENQPKEFNVTVQPKCDNLPVLGSALGKLKSGSASLNVIEYEDGSGYSVCLNVDACLFDSSQKGQKKTRKQRLNDFKNKVITSNENKKGAISARERASDAGQRATEIARQVREGTEEEYNNLRQEERDWNTVAEHLDNTSKSAKASLTEDAKVTFDLIFCLQFDFVTDKETYDSYLAEFAITIGGALNASKTWYTLLGVVPCYVNLSGGFQVNFLFAGSIDITNKISKTSFDTYAGNVQNLINRKGKGGSISDLIFTGQIRGGVGICDLIGISGYVAANIHIQGLEPEFFNTKYNWGVILNFTGGFILDLYITSIKVPDNGAFNLTKGYGNLEKYTSVKLMGKEQYKTSNSNDEEFIPSEEELNSQVVDYKYGTSNMELFGVDENAGNGLFGAKPHEKDVKILLKEAADKTRPKLIDLGNGKRFLTFLGARDVGDKATLYYTIYDGNKWATPKVVDDDGTTDSLADVLMVGDKVVITWMDAKKEIDKYDTELNYKEIYNSFNISAKIYDITTGTFSEKIIVEENNYFNLGPKLSSDNNNVYVVYMIRDIKNSTDVRDLLDMDRFYSTMVYNVININNLTVSPKKSIITKTKTQEDPLIVDYNRNVYELNGKYYYLGVYTVDEDMDIQTVDDREVYLSINDLSVVDVEGNMKQNRPIRITNNTVADITPKLNNVGGEMLLTWMQNGETFNLFNVNEIIESLFQEPTGSASYDSKDKTVDADWYKLTKEDLGLSTEDYENSIFKSLYNENLEPQTKKIINHSDKSTSIGQYIVTKANNDAYIYYTDFNENMMAGGAIELYGMRYRGAKNDPTLDKDRIVGFTDPIMITNNGYVIEDMDLFMDDDYRLYMVSDFYSQYIDDKGRLVKLPNKLVEFTYSETNSIEVNENSFEFNNLMDENRRMEVKFDVINKGLIAAKGYDLEARIVKVGNSNEIGDVYVDGGNAGAVEILSSSEFLPKTAYDISMEPGAKYEMSIIGEMPSDLTNSYIEITTLEKGVDLEVWRIYKKLPYEEKLQLKDFDIDYNKEDLKMHYTGEVVNNGNLDADKCNIVLRIEGKDSILATRSIGALKVGETADFDIPFELKKEYFDDYKQLKLDVSFERNGKVLYNTSAIYYPPEPLLVEIDKLNEIKKINQGDKIKLNISAFPWNKIAGEKVCISENAKIAYIDDNDCLIGVGEGKTNIKIIYEKNGLAKNIEVQVKKKEKKKPINSGGGGGGDSGHIAALDKYLDKYINGNPIVTGKPNSWYYEPTTDKWYRIGENGTAISGWYLDTDGRWYFMNSESMMIEGINCVSGKFYYFAEKDIPTAGIFRGQYLYDLPQLE